MALEARDASCGPESIRVKGTGNRPAEEEGAWPCISLGTRGRGQGPVEAGGRCSTPEFRFSPEESAGSLRQGVLEPESQRRESSGEVEKQGRG